MTLIREQAPRLTPSSPGPSPLDRSGRVLLEEVTWEGYQTFLREVGDRAVRLTYDNGFLEIEVPGKRDEELKQLAGALVEAVLNAKRIDYASLGSTTWSRNERLKGTEADQCYYIGDAAAAIRGKASIDLRSDPPPNFVIEVEVTSSAIDKLGIYAALAVNEVWRINESGDAAFYVLNRSANAYEPASASTEVPELTPALMTEHLRLLASVGHARAVWQLQDRLAGLLAGVPGTSPPNT
jgi:Uma2 family endonuclease